MARVLIVDDDERVRDLLLAALEAEGHCVAEAGTGAEAFQRLADGAFDVMLLDILMPDIDGLEVLAKLRREGSRVPVIALSGGGRLGTEICLINASMVGAKRSFAKPFDVKEVALAVAELAAARPSA